jgi:hypothetical protein
MFLNALIPKLLEFGLAETEMVIRRKASGSADAEKKDATGSGTRRRAGGEE